ncbi:hypothetical protein, conserved [Eimeria necatrix]|uniref:Uncharacterized protein n=1 Tax=Eimeria necatrix TaxID=51315 RepID=U6MSD9_9EIME|nr:hypothetical protein, conserved [Eimeria necatrix]CDJ64545.1 hypothetical protein, conserved [Eimeria necatrix]
MTQLVRNSLQHPQQQGQQQLLLPVHPGFAGEHVHPRSCFLLLLSLERLVALGGCDPSGFRFRILCRDIIKAAKRFQNLPRVCWLLAQLRATAAVDRLSRHLKPQLPLLYPQQLVTAAAALGTARLQHKSLLNAIAAAVMPYLSEISAGDLLKLLQGYAGAQLHHYGLIGAISAEVQRRVHVAAAAAAEAAAAAASRGARTAAEGGSSNDSSKSNATGDSLQWGTEDTWMQEASGAAVAATEPAAAPGRKRRQQNQITGIVPSIEQLVAFLESFTDLKYRDWSFLQLLSRQLQEALEQASPDRGFSLASPALLGRALESLRQLKANEKALLLAVLDHMHTHLHDCCPASLALVGRCTAEQLPPCLPHIREKHKDFLLVLRDMCPVLELEEVVSAAAFASTACVRRTIKDAVFKGLTERIMSLQDTPGGLSDVPLLAEILLRRQQLSADTFDVLARLLHRHLDVMEPQDLSRLSRFLRNAKAASLESETLLNATSRRVLRLTSVFSPPDLKEAVNCLMQAGPPERRYAVLLQRAASTDRRGRAPEDLQQGEAAAAEADEDTVSVSPKDLENSLQRLTNRPGELLLGRAAARARAKAKAAAAAAAAPEKTPKEAGVPPNDAAAPAEPEESVARRRHSHRQRILQEEGWDLLHRRVGAMRDMKQWL